MAETPCTGGPETDVDRLRYVAAQDLSAFVSLFTAYGPRVKAYLQKRGACEQFSEELAQEALLTVWRKAGQFDPERATASAWIFAIAHNLWIDGVRRERLMANAPPEEPGDECPTPLEILQAREDGRRLRAAIETLPPERHTILKMAFFDELSHTEIAETLGVPVGTVKSRIRLATVQLRRVLA